MKKAFAATLMAGATTMALILGACGGQQASSSSAQQQASSSSSQQQSSSSSSAQQTSSSSSEQQTSSSAAQQTSSQPASSSATTQQQGTQISDEEAKNIALKDAGVSEQEVTQLSVHLDTDDGVTKWEVDFHVGQKEYDYDIDPATGAILKGKSEIDD